MGQSRTENILENILGASNPLGEPQSREEALLMQLLESLAKKGMAWLGVTTTELTDGATVTTITINGEDVEAKKGDIAQYDEQNYAFNGEIWQTVDIIDLTALIDDTQASASKVYSSNKVEGIADNKADVVDLHSDMLYGITPTDRTFISNVDGTISTNNSFCTFFNIPIPTGYDKLYPYNDNGSNYYIRSICFFDVNGDFISGISGSAGDVDNGVIIPTGAITLACSLKYSDNATQALGKHYLTPTINGDVITKALKSDYELSAKSIKGLVLTDNIRKACVNFQFDDGNIHDEDIKSIFDAFGYKCGFAIISSADATGRRRYLGYQKAGYEIMSHADSATAMNDPTVSPETIENRLSSSKASLESSGFDIKGFVTPDSTMADIFKPILRKYYQWADTVYFGAYTGTGKPYMNAYDGVYNIYRVSLQSTTLENQKAVIDAAIANYGCVTFYGHAATLDTSNYLTTENLNALLTYIQSKVALGNLIISKPSDVILDYFEVRNDDITDEWTELTSSDVNLDSRFNIVSWNMAYNKKLKLVQFAIRINPKEAISGALDIFTFPFGVVDGVLIPNETTSRKSMTHSNSLSLYGSDTWAAGTNYRFSGVLKMQ